MIIEESRDASAPGEQTGPNRPLSAAETLARALGTTPAPQPPLPDPLIPPEEMVTENAVTE